MMEKDDLNEIFNEVNMLNSSIDIYSEFLQGKARNEEEKRNMEFKIELVKEEALKHNLRIRRAIDRLGY